MKHQARASQPYRSKQVVSQAWMRLHWRHVTDRSQLGNIITLYKENISTELFIKWILTILYIRAIRGSYYYYNYYYRWIMTVVLTTVCCCWWSSLTESWKRNQSVHAIGLRFCSQCVIATESVPRMRFWLKQVSCFQNDSCSWSILYNIIIIIYTQLTYTHACIL